MREPLNYNEFGPETCLDTKIFMLLWTFYTTHKLPKIAQGIKLLSIFGLINKEVLNPAFWLDNNMTAEQELDFRRNINDFHIGPLKTYILDGFNFFTTSNRGVWKARPFASSYDPPGMYCVENLKQVMKEVAEYDRILI